MRTLLRFDPWLHQGKLWVAPVLPAAFVPLRIDGVALGDSRVSLEVSDAETKVTGVPEGVDVENGPLPVKGPGGAV
jgi:hypothetical protein